MHRSISYIKNPESNIIVLNENLAEFLLQAKFCDYLDNALAIISPDGQILYCNFAFDNLFTANVNDSSSIEGFIEHIKASDAITNCVKSHDKIDYKCTINYDRFIQFDLTIILRPIKEKDANDFCAIMVTIGEENINFNKFYLARLQQEHAELVDRIKVISEDLMYKNKLVHDLFRDTPFSFMLLDSDRNVIQMNHACEELFDVSTREAMGMKCDQLLNCYQKDNLCPILDKGSSLKLQETETCYDKKPNTVLLRSAVKMGHNGDKNLILEAFVDISDRKRAERELEIHQAKLQTLVDEKTRDIIAVNKELEAFCYSVSHDLRGPIRSINGFSSLLLDEYSQNLGEEGADYASRVHKASLRMGDLIDDLLSLSRLSRNELSFTDLDFSALCQSVLEQIISSYPTPETHFEIQPGITVHADERMLTIMLENLLGNALKFTRSTPQPKIWIGTENNNEGQVIFIRDNGAGFDMQYAAKLFQPFERLHDRAEFEGNGIGLAIVKRIVNRHGGRIWAESQPTKGATFYFVLNT